MELYVLYYALARPLHEGLPPCVRGNPPSSPGLALCIGSTPVCTGKSAKQFYRGIWFKVYPRVYGEILL